MAENPPLMVLCEREGIDKSFGCRVETVGLELDILGEPVRFQINVADRHARLSEIVPFARALSTKLAMIVSDRLGAGGKSVFCCKGCSACCSYLVPLSIPEVFRLRQEVLAMPAEQGKSVLQSCLYAAKKILDERPEDSDINESTQTKSQSQISRLSRWYAGLRLPCPFLSNNICISYEQRPIACREHMVTGSAIFCDTQYSMPDGDRESSHIVQIPVSVLECLAELTAELEQSNVESVMLPLALPWAQENLERSVQTWPAVMMVEHFIEILKAAASKNSAVVTASN